MLRNRYIWKNGHVLLWDTLLYFREVAVFNENETSNIKLELFVPAYRDVVEKNGTSVVIIEI